MTGRNLGDLPGPVIGETLTKDSILVLPTGAIEHHGRHLPVQTDLLIADQLGTATVEAAAAEGIDAWVLPALRVTKSDEHAWAPGTLWLEAETLFRTVIDIGKSVLATHARTLVFYNGHGGNVALLQVALRELRRKYGLRTFLMGASVPAGDGINGPDEMGFGIHGGHSETSLVLHLRPDLVDMSATYRAVPEHLVGLKRIGFNGYPVQFGWTSDDFGSGGVIGDPTQATAEWGAELAARSIREGVASLREIAAFAARP